MADTQIPDGARQRLERMRSARGEMPAFFTSDLSVNEYYLLEQAGFEPLGFVMGTSFFHIGIQWIQLWIQWICFEIWWIHVWI